MSDYELLYYIYQKDEEALQLLLDKYEKSIYFTVKKIVESCCYICDMSDEMDELIQLATLEFYDAIFKYCDDGRCSFGVFAAKCVEMCTRKYIRHRRNIGNYQISKAFRLDEKVKEEEGMYYVDSMVNVHQEFEGDMILKWYHEKSLLEYLENELNENEFIIAKMKVDGYTQSDIGRILHLNIKRVNYVCRKMRKILLRYID